MPLLSTLCTMINVCTLVLNHCPGLFSFTDNDSDDESNSKEDEKKHREPEEAQEKDDDNSEETGEVDEEEEETEEDSDASQQGDEGESSSDRDGRQNQSVSMCSRSESKPYSSMTHKCEVSIRALNQLSFCAFSSCSSVFLYIGLWEEVHPHWKLQEAHAYSHRREALQLPGLQQSFLRSICLFQEVNTVSSLNFQMFMESSSSRWTITDWASHTSTHPLRSVGFKVHLILPYPN